MDWQENLFSYSELYRKQFGLKIHTHDSADEHRIEIRAEGKQIVNIKQENREHAYKWAYDLLKLYVESQLEKIEEFLKAV